MAVNCETTIAVLLSTLLIHLGQGSLLLSGSPDSFALYPPWAPNNNPLTLEFSTTSPSGLLLYMDADNYFYELKLVDSTLRLRYNIGSGTKILIVGSHLNNALWHRIQIIKTNYNTKLIVDGFVGVSRSDSDLSELYFEKVYVGGLPNVWNNRLDELALPSVVFEPKFAGGIRNIGYGGRSVTVIEWKGLLTNPPHSSCDRYDPCLHGGYCISTDNGPLCDCSLIDYEGVVCEREKPPASAHFNSKSYIYLKLNQGLISAQDEVELLFKTRLGNGLIFYAGDNVDYISIYLVAGHLTISINLGNGPLETLIGPNNLKFNDNQWHSVIIKRKTQEMSKTTSLCHVTTILDSIHYDRWTLSGQFSLLSSNYITLGGWTNNTKELYHHGFNGCLRKVTYKADTLVLNLIELARNGNQLIRIHGDVSFDCTEVPFERKPHQQGPQQHHRQGTTTSSIITLTHPSSFVTLATQLATPTSIQFNFRTNEPNGILLQSSTFVVELVSGNLYLLLANLYIQVSEDTVVDSKWHTIHLHKDKRAGFVKLDNLTITFNSDVSLGNDLVVSGENQRSWASNMGYAYIGCFGDLTINSDRVNLNSIIVQQDEATLRPHCPPGSSGFCLSNPCVNGGKCVDGWNRYICDCSHTNFTGHNCQLPNNVLSFNGFNTVSLQWPNTLQAEEIKLRFRSFKVHGHILLLKSSSSQDSLLMSLDFTRLKVVVNLNGREKILSTGSNLNDNQWHLVKYTRLGNSIRLQIDNEPSINGELSIKNVTCSYGTLQISPPNQPFIGHISQLILNNFNLLTNLNLFNFTSPPAETDVVNPVTLANYIKLPQLNVYASIDLSLKFITNDHNALLLYNGGYDHILMELVNGYVEYSYKYTHGEVRITSSVYVSDGKWHRVIVKKLKGVDLLIVDNEVNKRESLGGVIKLKGVLYVGGLPKDLLLPSMQTTSRFNGCLANTQLGDIIDLVQENLGNSGIQKGCHEPTCTESSCTGTCSNNECNCELTSMKGKFCNESDVEYFFNSTVLVYSLPSPRSSKEDKISLKLKSTKSNGALIQFLSADNNDFILVEMSSGLLSIRSSIDSTKTTLTHPTKLTSEWHLVNILRNGGNWTIKIDNGLEIWKNPGGSTPSIFRDLNQILIGGKFSNGPKKKARILEPFVGSMSGIIINKVNLLQLYEHSNSQIQLIGNPFSYNYNDLMMKAPASSHQPIEKSSVDDLISSGTITCPIDEDDCVPTSGGGDELITPIYIPNYSTFRPSIPCDDEDCVVSSSGDGGELHTWFTTTSSDNIISNTPDYYTPILVTPGIISPYPNTSTSGYNNGHHDMTSFYDPSTTTTKLRPFPDTPPVVITTPHKSDWPEVTEGTQRPVPPVVVVTPEKKPPFKPPTTPSYTPVPTNYRIFDWPETTNPTQKSTPKAIDPKNSFVAEASDSTLIIIIIIALLLIIIVSILIIFFMCRRRDDSIFKMESNIIDYGSAGARGPSGGGGGGRFNKSSGSGVKEWYV